VVIQLYGVRGSIPAPLRNNEYKRKVMEILRIFQEKKPDPSMPLDDFWNQLPNTLQATCGGDTTCISVISSKGKRYVVDAGTGSRPLGDDLIPVIMQAPNKELNLKMFFTHTHWDHIQGIPFFKPMYFPSVTIDFASPYADLEERFSRQMDPHFFPVPFHSTMSKKTFTTLEPLKPILFDDSMEVSIHPLKHPGGSYAYKFKENGKIFIFATDAEFTGTDMDYIIEIAPFFQDADYLVLDAQYTLDESFSKFDWGHTSYTMAVNCASQWKVKNLVLTHHEPAYNDEKIESIFEDALAHKEALKTTLNVHLAREGMIINLD
jgi:phosphoribosyl 1,2-cyclic phosphodiesterase